MQKQRNPTVQTRLCVLISQSLPQFLAVLLNLELCNFKKIVGTNITVGRDNGWRDNSCIYLHILYMYLPYITLVVPKNY